MKLERTITSVFMMPTLKIGRERLDENGFINAYIKDNSRQEQYKNCIYLLFKPTDLDKFKMFLDEEYERTKAVIDDYDYPDGYVVVVYELNMKWEADYHLIKQGRYSKTSKEFQNEIPKVVKILKDGLRRDEISLQHRIFRKSTDLKEYWERELGVNFDDEMEVWQGWIIEKEILYIEKMVTENV